MLYAQAVKCLNSVYHFQYVKKLKKACSKIVGAFQAWKTLDEKKKQKRAEEEGVPDFMDMIADETICDDSEKLMEFLTEKGHPALEMDSIL